MFLHNLKIALRNILKYKTQSVISILGLAVGFTAFAFTMSWIRYEMGYDSHNPDAGQIYYVVNIDSNKLGGFQKFTPVFLAPYLEASFPEVAAATTVYFKYGYPEYFDDCKESIPVRCSIHSDTSLFRVFYPDVKVNFQEPMNSSSHLITESINRKMELKGIPPKEGLIGVVPDFPHHSNIPFDVLTIESKDESIDQDLGWLAEYVNTFIRIKKNVDVESLRKKLKQIYINEIRGVMNLELIPLQKVHYLFPDENVNIKISYLIFFAGVSVLLILYAIVNYLMLFINRIKNRSRELALRKVNAASNKQLMVLLLGEVLLILLASIFIGGILTELLFPQFIKLSMIDAPKSFFVSEMLLYAGSIVLFSILVLWIPVKILMKRSIRENIQPHKKTLFGVWSSSTLICLFLQLAMGILLIFCTSIFLYQYLFLNRSDIGFNRHNINTVRVFGTEIPIDEIKRIPGVKTAIPFKSSFLPEFGSIAIDISTSEYGGAKEEVRCEQYFVRFPEFIPFFEIPILEGRNINKAESGVCLVNQSLKKIMGGNEVVGKKIGERTIVGVIPDLLVNSPQLPVKPTIYISDEVEDFFPKQLNVITYKFEEGSRSSIEAAIKEIAKKNSITENNFFFFNMDEVYAGYTKSERYLLILLSIMTAVAILIAIFGIYSMITLSCSQRRKEIAIRKVNGARMKEILALFARQYFAVTLLAYIAAFPIGIYVMQSWLEQYTRRVSMEWWIFAGIVLLIGLIVFASIFFRVYRAAKENPAEVVKGE